MRAAIYSRVSTDKQTTANQIERLREVAKVNEWPIVHEYQDQGISGSKGREQRPGLDAALKGAERHSYDVLMVWSLDRLGRSSIDVLKSAEVLRKTGRALFLDRERIDTSTDAGRCFFAIMAAIAELDRQQIIARVNAGLDRARKAGKRLGRPEIDQDTAAKVIELLQTGAGINKVARLAGCANGTVSRIKASLAA